MASIKLRVAPAMGGKFSIDGEVSERLAFGVHTLIKIGDPLPDVVNAEAPDPDPSRHAAHVAYVAAARVFLDASEAYLQTLSKDKQ